MQALTVKIRLFPDHPDVLRTLGKEYIRVVNHLTETAEQLGVFPKTTTKDVETILPSAVCNQAIRDAKKPFVMPKIFSIKSKNLVFVPSLKNRYISLTTKTIPYPKIQLLSLSL